MLGTYLYCMATVELRILVFMLYICLEWNEDISTRIVWVLRVVRDRIDVVFAKAGVVVGGLTINLHMKI